MKCARYDTYLYIEFGKINFTKTNLWIFSIKFKILFSQVWKKDFRFRFWPSLNIWHWMLRDSVGEEIIGKKKRLQFFFREITYFVKLFEFFSQAGYYCNVFLWASFSLWILMNITLVAVPRYVWRNLNFKFDLTNF